MSLRAASVALAGAVLIACQAPGVKAAKALGLTTPPEVIVRAARVIE